MAVIDGFQLEETLKGFRFNELGGISILKKWRELAVICQIDIEIVSISRENYRNYASIPANGFYGYCTLVMRDHALPPVKITQPRQTMYIARNDSAMSNWFTYLQQVRAQENYRGIENLICFNTGLLGGACAPKPCKDLPKFSFDEIPLREVMVKADYGTQFVIEYSFWNMNNELSACGDIITPKSNQTDGSKDSGLPPNGSSPNSGNPNNPYAGLPPADGIDKEGVLPPNKLNNQDNPNPDNFVTPPEWGYFAEIEGTAKDPNQCAKVCFFKNVYLINSNDSVTLSSVAGNTSCGVGHSVFQIVGSYSGNIGGGIYGTNGTVSVKIVRAANMPSGYYYCE